MIRETKVGMVVAGSFLSLAGGVLGLRMQQGEGVLAPQNPPAVVADAGNTSPPPVDPAKDASHAPPPGALVQETKPVIPAPVVETPKDIAPPPPAPTPVVETPKPTNQDVVPLPTNSPLMDNKPADDKAAVPVPIVPAPVVPAPVVPVPVPVPVPAAGDGPKPVDPPKPDAFQFPPAPPANEPKAEEKPKPVDPPPAPFEFKPAETPKPADTPMTETKAVEPPPMVPAPTPTPAPVVPAPVVPAPAAEQPKAPDPVKAVEPPPPGTAALMNDTSAPRPLPDAFQPAAVKPTPKPPQQSESFLEEEYRIAAGDTFATVSRRFYYTDKYAEALRQYNRDYPIASAGLRQDPPRLTPGTQVWIPPARVLDRRYGKDEAKATATPAATASGSPNWTPSPVRPASTGTKTYRVKEGGESLTEIARKYLGRPQSWGEVYQLNPQLASNPTLPIPAGTLLKLPAEARVD